MRKQKKIKKVIVDFKTWLRGNDNSLLRNDEGKMCCLGFECRQRGFKNEEITDVGTPEDFNISIPGMTRKIGGSFNAYENTKLVTECVLVNDDDTIDDNERIKKLKRLFRRRKMTIKFKNVPKNLIK